MYSFFTINFHFTPPVYTIKWLRYLCNRLQIDIGCFLTFSPLFFFQMKTSSEYSFIIFVSLVVGVVVVLVLWTAVAKTTLLITIWEMQELIFTYASVGKSYVFNSIALSVCLSHGFSWHFQDRSGMKQGAFRNILGYTVSRLSRLKLCAVEDCALGVLLVLSVSTITIS